MRAALTEFLTLGKLGAISLGLTRSQVHEALGEPEGWLNKYSVVGRTHLMFGHAQNPEFAADLPYLIPTKCRDGLLSGPKLLGKSGVQI